MGMSTVAANWLTSWGCTVTTVCVHCASTARKGWPNQPFRNQSGTATRRPFVSDSSGQRLHHNVYNILVCGMHGALYSVAKVISYKFRSKNLLAFEYSDLRYKNLFEIERRDFQEKRKKESRVIMTTWILWHRNMIIRWPPLSQVGSRRKRCPGQFGQDGMGSIPATPSTKHASCFPPSSMPASIEISIQLIVWLYVDGLALFSSWLFQSKSLI